jgi:hypothetical protein
VAGWQDVERIALGLPEVEVSTSWDAPAVKVRGKVFACASPREEGALVLWIDPDERPLMLGTQPDVYYVTPHYEGYPRVVLARLDAISEDELRERLTEAWLVRAPKRLAAKLAGNESQSEA